MKLIDSIRTSLSKWSHRLANKKQEAARHRLASAAEVVAIVSSHKDVSVTHVRPKYMRMVADLKHVIMDLRKDHVWLEGRAKTCAYNNTVQYTNRLTGESFTIASYCDAEPHVRQLARDILHLQDALNTFEPHPDYKMMRRSAKSSAKSAA